MTPGVFEIRIDEQLEYKFLETIKKRFTTV